MVIMAEMGLENSCHGGLPLAISMTVQPSDQMSDLRPAAPSRTTVARDTRVCTVHVSTGCAQMRVAHAGARRASRGAGGAVDGWGRTFRGHERDGSAHLAQACVHAAGLVAVQLAAATKVTQFRNAFRGDERVGTWAHRIMVGRKRESVAV